MAGLKEIAEKLKYLVGTGNISRLVFSGTCLWCEKAISEDRKQFDNTCCSDVCETESNRFLEMFKKSEHEKEDKRLPYRKNRERFINDLKSGKIEVTFKRKGKEYWESSETCLWCEEDIDYYRCDIDKEISCSDTCQRYLDNLSITMVNNIGKSNLNRNVVLSAFGRCEDCIIQKRDRSQLTAAEWENSYENLWTKDCFSCFNYYVCLYNNGILKSKFKAWKEE